MEKFKVINILLVVLLVASASVNLLGAFALEIGFDALWYHLTLPKLYLQAGKIYHTAGGLLYYSEMPRLGEILYMFALKLMGDVGPRLIGWGAGIGTAVVIYKMARRYLESSNSILVCCLFYITPLVGWQSGSAYVDLLRTFFEALALYFLLSKKPALSGLAIGLAISTKTLAIGSLAVLMILLFFRERKLGPLLKLTFIAFIVSVPWFLSSYLNTGHPFYPIGAGILDSSHSLNLDFWNLGKVFGDFWKLFLFPEDPSSPIYLIFLPFIVWMLLHLGQMPPERKRIVSLLTTFVLLAYLVWWITPRTGGGRFILPYLPAFAVLVGITLASLKDKWVKALLILTMIFVTGFNLSYRVLAANRFLPYLLGKETRASYLCRNLSFNLGDFYDCSGRIGQIVGQKVVLIQDVHNLYYVNFPFIHESWYRGEKYDYVLVKSKSAQEGQIVYEDHISGFKLLER